MEHTESDGTSNSARSVARRLEAEVDADGRSSPHSFARAMFLLSTYSFLPADYGSLMRHELELCTQALDEALQGHIRGMDDLFPIAEPQASNEEHLKELIRQAHPTFSAYLRGGCL